MTRTFYGAGSIASIASIENAVGLDIAPLTIALSPIDVAVELALKGYDLRAAPIEIYLGYKDVEAPGFLAPPRCVFEGVINGAPSSTPPPGGESEAELTAVPYTRLLTVPRPARLSDAQQSERGGDRILRYADTAHLVQLPWGVKSGRLSGNKGGGVT